MSDPFADILGGLRGDAGFAGTPLGRAAAAARRDAKKKPSPDPVRLPQIRGKRIDGVLYVRAEDVADALQSIAPTTAARLIKKLRGES